MAEQLAPNTRVGKRPGDWFVRRGGWRWRSRRVHASSSLVTPYSPTCVGVATRYRKNEVARSKQLAGSMNRLHTHPLSRFSWSHEATCHGNLIAPNPPGAHCLPTILPLVAQEVPF